MTVHAGLVMRPRSNSRSSKRGFYAFPCRNAPFKHVFLDRSDDVRVQGITCNSPPDSPNTDSLHLSYITNAVIDGCDLSGGDDNIAILDGTSGVTISNVVASSGHGIR